MRKGIGNALRMKILTRDGFKCTYCGSSVDDGAVLQVDHILPVKKGGTNDEFNLTTSCRDCNMGKFDREIHELEGMRAKSAVEQLDKEKEIKKSKKELEDAAYELIKTKKENDYSPEFSAYKRYVEESGYIFETKNYKPVQSLIKKYGLDYIVEITECIKEGGSISPGYLKGIIFNKELKEENPVGYENYLLFKREVIDKLYLKYPLEKSVVQFLCKTFNKGFKTDFDFFYIKEIVDIIKKRRDRNEIPRFIQFLGINACDSEVEYLTYICMKYIKEVGNFSDKDIEEFLDNNTNLTVDEKKLKKERKVFWERGEFKRIRIEGGKFLITFDRYV